MDNNNAKVMNEWARTLAKRSEFSFAAQCQELLVHAESDPEWFLHALDDLLRSLNESVPAWSPEGRLLSAIFDTGATSRHDAHREIRVARRALEIAADRGDPMGVLARLMLLARALVEYRRAVRQWAKDPWVEMAALHAGEAVSNEPDVLGEAIWISDIAREYLEMESAGRRRAREMANR